jgi:hypothetical protein
VQTLDKILVHKESVAWTSLVRSILEYGAACLDPYKQVHIIALDRVQKKVTKFVNHISYSVWETLAQVVYVLSWKRTPEKEDGKVLGTGYKDHANWAGKINFGKLGVGQIEQILWIFIL